MDPKPLTILHIEDNSGDARLVQELLGEAKDFPCQIECVDRLANGLTRLAQGGIDVVLLDLALPDGRGLDNFTQVHTQTPEVPVILMTGTMQDEELAAKAIQQGTQDYLPKGMVDSRSLVRAIRYAIERKRNEEALKAAKRELEDKVKQLELLNHVMMAREERVLELKAQVKALQAQVPPV